MKCKKLNILRRFRSRRVQTKGKIAMETIMIYGAALLVVTLAIGSLIYFGVLDLGKWLPDKCQTGNSIACENFVVGSDGTIQLEFRNRVGKVINIASVDVKGLEDWEGIIECDALAAPANGIANGNLQLISLTGCDTLPEHVGRKIKASVVIGYNVGGSAITQRISGELQATVAE